MQTSSITHSSHKSPSDNQAVLTSRAPFRCGVQGRITPRPDDPTKASFAPLASNRLATRHAESRWSALGPRGIGRGGPWRAQAFTIGRQEPPGHKALTPTTSGSGGARRRVRIHLLCREDRSRLPYGRRPGRLGLRLEPTYSFGVLRGFTLGAWFTIAVFSLRCGVPFEVKLPRRPCTAAKALWLSGASSWATAPSRWTRASA
jgi:hypothetical protein